MSNGAAPTFESNDDMLESYLIIGSDRNILLSRGNQRSTIPLGELDHRELTELVDVRDIWKGEETMIIIDRYRDILISR